MSLFNCFFLMVTLFACTRKMTSEAPTSDSADRGSTIIATSGPAQKTPMCIVKKIDSLKKEHVWNPPAEIYEYEYQGKKVYSISADCCDFFNTVVDSNCNYVCAPSGGFTGKGDGKCVDFFEVAKQLRLVWRDERQRK